MTCWLAVVLHIYTYIYKQFYTLDVQRVDGGQESRVLTSVSIPLVQKYQQVLLIHREPMGEGGRPLVDKG